MLPRVQLQKWLKASLVVGALAFSLTARVGALARLGLVCHLALLRSVTSVFLSLWLSHCLPYVQ